MQSTILFDCEFLTASGAPSRFWCGPFDPDPTVVQIGTVKLGLDGTCPVIGTFQALVRPTDRLGNPVALDPAFTALTGLDENRLAREGRDLGDALNDFARFSDGAAFWSWGKDEMNLMAISPYVAGIPAPIPAHRFGNACRLLVRAGIPEDTVHGLRSHSLCAHFGLPSPEGHAHDAAHDALSLATVIRHLLVIGRLSADDLAMTAP